ncbi:RodZ domain-containing protein [Solidesulfovibrio magneticus]|nr:RodZ domain-containing protein [Solidesulfovibrio magneticus]
MDLREIGTMLREERERQGLSLDTVSDKTKISRSCLAAIEEGNDSLLPHPVYAKGFIKNYARLLGVDHAEFASRLSTVYQVEEPTAFRDISLVTDLPDDDCGCSVSSSAPRPPVTLWLAGAGAVLVVLALGWYLFSHVFSGSGASGDEVKPSETATVAPSKPLAAPAPEPTPPVAAPTPVQPAPTVPPVVTPTVPPAVTPAPAETLKPQSETAKTGAPTADDKATQDIAVSGPAGSAPAVPAAPEATPAAPAAPVAPTAKNFTVGETGPHVVTIAANERCWLQAGADGGAMHETMLEKGDTFTGRFADNMLVRLGNAGAVEIHFDNKLYPLQAGKGSVKTLKFVAKKTDQPTSANGQGQPSAVPQTAAAPTAQPAASLPVASPAVAPTPGPAAENASGAKEVEIYGQDGSWVIVSPDKGPSKEIYVKKGQRITVPFGEKIEIKLGNPSSVVFRYNGQETPVTTEKGAIKTIRFPQ